MKFYSQNGEDFVLSELLKNERNGFFIEVGCIDGRRFSNSLAFEEVGWRGMCIEAHKDYIPLLHENRPNSIIVNAAVGEIDEETVFYANSRGTLSTLDKEKETLWKEKFSQYFNGFEVQKINKLTLNTIFRKNKISEISFISLDIEGYEPMAMRGLDLEIWKPKVLVIEADSSKEENQLDGIVPSKLYKKLCRLKGNIFYVRKDFKHGPIEKSYKGISITHLSHPLDHEKKDNTFAADLTLKFYKKSNRPSLRHAIANWFKQ